MQAGVAMQGLVHPGPLLFLYFSSFFFPLPAWQFLWAGPFFFTARPKTFPAQNSPLKFSF
jgi:hypothetical protein